MTLELSFNRTKVGLLTLFHCYIHFNSYTNNTSKFLTTRVQSTFPFLKHVLAMAALKPMKGPCKRERGFLCVRGLSFRVNFFPWEPSFRTATSFRLPDFISARPTFFAIRNSRFLFCKTSQKLLPRKSPHDFLHLEETPSFAKSPLVVYSSHHPI